MKCGTKVVSTTEVPAPAVNVDSKKEERVRFWLSANANKLPESQLHVLKDKMMQMSDADLDRISYINFTDPTMMLIISIFFGMVGVDRFALGDIGLGVGKLLTCGGIYIWWIVDFFYIMDATKEKNMQKLNTVLYI
jgi:TM2 domain-containing membrane protein YozV